MDYDFAISIILKNASRLQNVIQTIYAIKHSIYPVDVIIYGSEPVLQFLKQNQSYVFSTTNLISNKNMYSRYKKVIEVDDSWIYDDRFIKTQFMIENGFSNIVDVCLICDKNYLKYVRNVIQQIKEFASENTKYNAYVLYDGFISDELNQLKDDISTSQVHIIPIPVVNLFYKDMKNNMYQYISSSTNIRLLICDVLPQCVKKLLYLDCDISIQKSIDEIYQFDLGKFSIGGVRDFGISIDVNHAMSNHYLKKFNLKEYVNGGVLLFDMTKLRMSGFHNECYSIYRQHTEFRFNDQDILNYYCMKNKCIKLMPYEYNWQVYSSIPLVKNGKMEERKQSSVIVHFVGKDKKGIGKYD